MMHLRTLALVFVVLAAGACSQVESTFVEITQPPAASLHPFGNGIALLCAPPAYAECTTDLETFFEGWTADNLHDQLLGVCDFGSGKGDVVWIDAEAEAQAECEAAQEFRDSAVPIEVVRVVRLP